MNPAMESLLESVRTQPMPAAHTSSHWQRYGGETLVERQGSELVLRGVGFGSMVTRNPAWHLLHLIERMSYRRVTAPLKAYPSVWAQVRSLARDLSFGCTFDVWKCGVILALLLEHGSAHRLSPKTFVVIGDGYGFLGALIRRLLPGSRLYCVDLPKTLVFQVRTHEIADPAAKLSVLSAAGQDPSAEILFVAPQEVERIPDEIDCAINIASMQEMNPLSITSYFAFLRRRSTPRSRFYCVNRLHKELPDGEVVRFEDYPWRPEDEVFLDGPCPYYTHFFAPYTRPQGPRRFGFRIPFVNSFDGIHWHRLVRLAPEAPRG